LLKEFFPTIEDWDLNTGDYWDVSQPIV
jgi:hypothetical protein